MAKKKPTNQAEDKPEDGSRAESKKLLQRVRDRYKIMTEADQTNREKALADLKFAHVPGEQWDPDLKKERGDRPCYEFNKLRITIKRVINHIRANRPAGKVRAVEDGDKDTADIYEGQIRNIWNVSDGDTVVDYEAEYVVAAGMGGWRVTTEYSSDTVFDQDIFIRAIKNPFCLYADPSASDSLKRDAEDWILTEKISNSSYEQRWPKAKRTSFEDVTFDDDEDWTEDEQTRICEYWYKKPAVKTLYLLENGKTVDQLPQGVVALKQREVKCYEIWMVIVSGDAILEGPTKWAGSMFPFVQVHGEWRVIDGKVEWHGLTRFSKDAQRAYNVQRTSEIETVALTPQAKWLMSAKQFLGLEQHIADAHKKNIPVMLYNDVPNTNAPQWLGGAQVSPGSAHLTMVASEDIKATSGIFDASLGNQSNETSGRAIRARQEQGEIATYNFPDNIAKGIRRTYEILVDLIPKIYDSTRSLRILGADMTEKYVKVNEVVPDPENPGQTMTLNDLSRGKYDVTVTVGPNYSTQRQEASETFTQLAQAFPPIMQVAGDILVKNMDVPGSEQLAERLRFLLPPQIQESINQDKPVPPEVQAVMNQAQQAMQIVQQQSQLVQAAAQEAEQGKAEAEKAKAAVDQARAELKVAQAQFEAKVAQELAKLVQKEAALTVKETNIGAATNELQSVGRELEGKVSLGAEAQQATQNIQALTEQFGQIAAEILQRIENPPEKPKTTRRVSAKRNGGGLDFQVDDVDEAGQVVSSRAGTVTRSPTGELLGQMS